MVVAVNVVKIVILVKLIKNYLIVEMNERL